MQTDGGRGAYKAAELPGSPRRKKAPSPLPSVGTLSLGCQRQASLQPRPKVTARAWILRSCPLSLLSCLRVRSLLDLRPSPAFNPNWNAALGSISLFCLYACARGGRPGLASSSNQALRLAPLGFLLSSYSLSTLQAAAGGLG
jgi:hypothetical protein